MHWLKALLLNLASRIPDFLLVKRPAKISPMEAVVFIAVFWGGNLLGEALNQWMNLTGSIAQVTEIAVPALLILLLWRSKGVKDLAD